MRPSQKDFGNTWILATSFIVAGLSTSFGIWHAWFVDPVYLRSCPILLMGGGGFFYIVGAILYAKKWPESVYTGKFDIVGNSHNIFHIACIIGALMHWYVSIRMFHERQLYHCPK